MNYPVLIPTLNRYEHLRRCVESLSRCSGANLTELVIGLDFPPSKKYEEGYNLINNYLSQIKGFGKVTVLRAEKNLGASGNFRALVEYARSQGYDAYITSEDDNEFSPCFLDYMNQTLLKYKSNPKIIRISGYNAPELKGVSGKNIFCNIDSPAYGMGHWAHKNDALTTDYIQIQTEMYSSFSRLLKMFWTYPALVYKAIRMIEKKVNYGDIRLSMHNLMYGTFTLCPTVSMARNWGCDGSGLHSGIVKGLEQADILTDSHFSPDDIEICATKQMRKKLLRRNMPSGTVDYVLHFIYYLAVTIKFFFGKISHGRK